MQSSLLPALLFLGCIFNFADKANTYFLEIPIYSNTHAIPQVFFDIGNGFNEKDSTYDELNASKAGVIKLRIPVSKIQALRFDPSNAAATMLIGAASIHS